MKKSFSIVFAVLLISFFITGLSGCVFVNFSNFNAVNAKGRPEKFEYDLNGFNNIKISGYYEINYYTGGTNSSGNVILEVPPDVKKYFVVEVINNELVVRTTRRIVFPLNQPPVLTITSPELNRLAFDGAGTFTAHDKITAESVTLLLKGAGSGKVELDVENLNADISGAGKFELAGRAGAVNLSLSGAGELDALSLLARDATVNLSGAGTIKVNCSDNLKVKANGVGSVEYRGNPGVNLERGGMVSIRKIGG